MYAYSPKREAFNDFLKRYVATYDSLLAARHPDQEFMFGLDAKEGNGDQDNMQAIRAQHGLRSIYLDTLRALGNSGGYITPRLLSINQKLSLNLPIQEGQIIPTELAREMLDKSLQYIMATLNEASEDKLRELAGSGSSAAYAVAGGYGSAAAAAGIRYEGACPSSQNGAATAEAAALSSAFRSEKDPTKCVKCPECRKTVDLPKELFKKGIYHCVECKATYHKGKRISLREEQDAPDVLDQLSDHWESIKEQTELEKARARRLEAQRELAA
jgi:ribosomal protein L37AE/L43A